MALPDPGQADRRRWLETERPGERIALSAPLEGIRVMSVAGSDRPWAEVHETLTLCLVHSGQGGVGAKWRSGRQSLSTGSGEIMAIEPGACHKTERVYGGKASFSVVQIDPRLLTRIAQELDLKGTPRLRACNLASQPLRDAIERFVARAAACADGLELECCLVDVVCSLWSARPDGRPGDPVVHRGVRRARDAIHKLYESAVATGAPPALPNLQALARLSDLSKSRFPHAFADWLGISPHAYLNLCRLTGARRLLEEGASATDAAALLGFSDLPAMSRYFRRQFGLSPRGWQQQIKERSRGHQLAPPRTG